MSVNFPDDAPDYEMPESNLDGGDGPAAPEANGAASVSLTIPIEGEANKSINLESFGIPALPGDANEDDEQEHQPLQVQEKWNFEYYWYAAR